MSTLPKFGKKKLKRFPPLILVTNMSSPIYSNKCLMHHTEEEDEHNCRECLKIDFANLQGEIRAIHLKEIENKLDSYNQQMAISSYMTIFAAATFVFCSIVVHS